MSSLGSGREQQQRREIPKPVHTNISRWQDRPSLIRRPANVRIRVPLGGGPQQHNSIMPTRQVRLADFRQLKPLEIPTPQVVNTPEAKLVPVFVATDVSSDESLMSLSSKSSFQSFRLTTTKISDHHAFSDRIFSDETKRPVNVIHDVITDAELDLSSFSDDEMAGGEMTHITSLPPSNPSNPLTVQSGEGDNLAAHRARTQSLRDINQTLGKLIESMKQEQNLQEQMLDNILLHMGAIRVIMEKQLDFARKRSRENKQANYENCVKNQPSQVRKLIKIFKGIKKRLQGTKLLLLLIFVFLMGFALVVVLKFREEIIENILLTF